MHFEILVEGHTELIALSTLMRKIIGEYGNPHTWRIHKHRGIGSIPENPENKPDKRNQTLLHNLPSKLRGYGRAMTTEEAVVVLVDLDRNDCNAFKNKLTNLLTYCNTPPNTLFRIAIEELEAWYFGDPAALKAAYPDLKNSVLSSYLQDSQCGTWEKLADAIYTGGLKSLLSHGKRSIQILEQKCIWAKDIAPQMNVEINSSPSFCCFRDGIRRMAQYT